MYVENTWKNNFSEMYYSGIYKYIIQHNNCNDINPVYILIYLKTK